MCVWKHLEAVRGRSENMQALRRAGDVDNSDPLGVGLADHVSTKMHDLGATSCKEGAVCAWPFARALPLIFTVCSVECFVSRVENPALKYVPDVTKIVNDLLNRSAPRAGVLSS